MTPPVSKVILSTVEAVVLGTINKNKFISAGEISQCTTLTITEIDTAILKLVRLRLIVQNVSGTPKRYSPFISKEERKRLEQKSTDYKNYNDDHVDHEIGKSATPVEETDV